MRVRIISSEMNNWYYGLEGNEYEVIEYIVAGSSIDFYKVVVSNDPYHKLLIRRVDTEVIGRDNLPRKEYSNSIEKRFGYFEFPSYMLYIPDKCTLLMDVLVTHQDYHYIGDFIAVYGYSKHFRQYADCEDVPEYEIIIEDDIMVRFEEIKRKK